MRNLTNHQTVSVQWARELYKVSQSTLDVADSRRSCWMCGRPFVIGDGMTVCGTDKGNKLMHTRCYRQEMEGREDDKV